MQVITQETTEKYVDLIGKIKKAKKVRDNLLDMYNDDGYNGIKHEINQAEKELTNLCSNFSDLRCHMVKLALI